MFYENGKWIPIVEAFQAARNQIMRESKPLKYKWREIDANDKEAVALAVAELQEVGGKLTAESNSLTWGACDSASEVGIVLASGRTISASKALLEWISTTDARGVHVNLSLGTVGTGFMSDLDDEETAFDQDKRRYGAFLHCPIVISRKNFELYLHENKEIKSNNSQSEKNVSDLIIAAFDADPSLSKDQAERYLATGMPRRAFIRAWTRAAEARPALSRPGRRSNRDA